MFLGVDISLSFFDYHIQQGIITTKKQYNQNYEQKGLKTENPKIGKKKKTIKFALGIIQVQ